MLILLVHCSSDPPTTPPPQPTPDKYGQLQISVTGLSPGIDADIQINGPNGFSKHVTSTTTLDSLNAGEYVVVASEVVDSSGRSHFPTPETQNLTVVEDTLISSLVTYLAEEIGAISITIDGLPSRDYGLVRLYESGESSYNEILQTSVIDTLSPGEYFVECLEVTASDGFVYEPDIDTQTVTVINQQVTDVTITYEPKFGKLQINIDSLPAGNNGLLHLYKDGQSGTYQEITEPVLIDTLDSGIYWVEAFEVILTNGDTYQPTVSLQQVQIIKGSTADVTIIYEPKYGQFSVIVTGLPNELNADLILRNSYGNEMEISGDTLIDSLEAGEYVFLAHEVMTLDGMVYTPDVDSQSVQITGGELSNASVTYSPKYGRLSLVVNGLPFGVNAAISMSGDAGNYLWNVSDSIFIDSLNKGSYMLYASEVVTAVNDTFFARPDSMSITIVPGDTANVIFEYAKGLSINVYHGPAFGGFARSAGSYKYQSSSTPISWNLINYVDFPYPDGYVLDGCDITGQNITNTGLAMNETISSPCGTASGSTDLSYDKSQKLLTIENTASSVAYPLGNDNGSGFNELLLTLGQNVQSLPSIMIDIDNPAEDTLDIIINWSYAGAETEDDSNLNLAQWQQVVSVTIDPDPCNPGTIADTLFAGGEGFESNPDSTSGVGNFVLTGNKHRIGLGIRNNCLAGFDVKRLPVVTSNGSSSQAASTITVQIVPRNK